MPNIEFVNVSKTSVRNVWRLYRARLVVDVDARCRRVVRFFRLSEAGLATEGVNQQRDSPAPHIYRCSTVVIESAYDLGLFIL